LKSDAASEEPVGMITTNEGTEIFYKDWGSGGGEVVRYIGRHGEDRVAKAVLMSAVPPLMVKTDADPDGRCPRSSCKTGR
jgi:non-heme chloroperoxidase